jgi:beta-galactosidase
VDMIDPDAPDTEVLATYTGKFYAGKAAITRRPVGKGWVQYIGVMDNEDLTLDALSDMAEELGLDVQEMPEGLFRSQRQTADGRYTFYLNFSTQASQIDVPRGQDVLTGRAVEGEQSIAPLDLLIVKS